MNYYVEMIRDFVISEIKKENGKFLDDGEYMYACGLVFRKLTAGEHKDIVKKKEIMISDSQTFLLLSVEIKSLIKEYTKEVNRLKREDKNLIHMVENYKPKSEQIDSVMKEVFQEALKSVPIKKKYERQERYQKKVGLVSKTYKLNADIVDEFARICKVKGVPLGPTLADLMQGYINEYKESR